MRKSGVSRAAITAGLAIALGFGGFALAGCASGSGAPASQDQGTAAEGEAPSDTAASAIDFGTPLEISTDPILIGDIKFTPRAAAYGFSEDENEDVIILAATIENAGDAEIDVLEDYTLFMHQVRNFGVDDCAAPIDMGDAVQLTFDTYELPMKPGETANVFFCGKPYEFDEDVTIQIDKNGTEETVEMPYFSIAGLRTDGSRAAEDALNAMRQASSYSDDDLAIGEFPQGVHVHEVKDGRVKLTADDNSAYYMTFQVKDKSVEDGVNSAVKAGGEDPIQIECNGIAWQYVKDVGSSSGIVTHKFFAATSDGQCMQVTGYGLEYDTLVAVLDHTTIR